MPVTTRFLGSACLLLIAFACTACQRNAASDTAPADGAPATDATRPAAPSAGRPSAALQTPPPDDPARIVKQMPDADAPTPAVAVGAEITYGCDDGNLVVTYRGPTATLVLPDGSRGAATLSVEDSVKAGGEVYVGDRLGLRRIGSVVELQSADAPTRRCIEAGGTA